MQIKLVNLKRRYESLKPEIDAAIKRVIDRSAFIQGLETDQLEGMFALYCRGGYGIACSNGTSALYLALKALNLPKGSEVITVPNTFIATAEAITMAGYKVRFVDVDKDTLLMDMDKLQKAITKKTRAVIPVHLFGQICDMERLKEIAVKYDLKVIEDAAQAHGASYAGRKAPYLDTATYSFFPGKIMGAFGDAGMVVTRDPKLAGTMKLLTNHGRENHHEHSIEGFNFRMDNLQAAILLPQLRKLNGWVEKRRQLAEHYDWHLSDLEEKGILKTPWMPIGNYHAYYMYVVRTKKRDELREYLVKKGVSTGIHYPVPLHLQPAYAYLGLKKGSFPVAEKAAKEILSLPIYPEMKPEEVKYVCDAIKEFYEGKK